MKNETGLNRLSKVNPSHHTKHIRRINMKVYKFIFITECKRIDEYIINAKNIWIAINKAKAEFNMLYSDRIVEQMYIYKL